MSNPSMNISVTAPVEQAINRVKRMLFQPFDLSKWIAIGFTAWLAMLGEGGGFGGNFSLPGRPGRVDPQRMLAEASDYVMQNLRWIIPLAIFLVVVGLVLWGVFTWLSSRGQFMFLHCVAQDRAEISGPWHAYAREGNSLFLFRLVLGLISSVILLPPLVFTAVLVVRMVQQGRATPQGIVSVAGLVLFLVVGGLVFGLIFKLTADFVVPIMSLRRCRCLEGWREAKALIEGNFGAVLLYLLFQLALNLAVGAMVMIVVIMTCCIAGCLLAIPFLGTVLLLPVLIFKRSYTLYYLAQYGPQYDVFGPPALPAAAGGVAPA